MERKPRTVPPVIRKARKVPKETSWKNFGGSYYFKNSHLPIYVSVPFEEDEKGWNVCVSNYKYKHRMETLEGGKVLGLLVAKEMAQQTIREIDKELKKLPPINGVLDENDWENAFTKAQLAAMTANAQEEVDI